MKLVFTRETLLAIVTCGALFASSPLEAGGDKEQRKAPVETAVKSQVVERDKEEQKSIPETVADLLTEFGRTKDCNLLSEAIRAVQSMGKHDAKGDVVLQDIRKGKLELWLKIVDTIDESIDPRFDPSDLKLMPSMNVAPPGPKYCSGISPEKVQEPEVRKAYEALIAKNEKKRVRYNLQLGLRRSKTVAMRELVRHILRAYAATNGDIGEVRTALNQLITNPETRKDIVKDIVGALERE